MRNVRRVPTALLAVVCAASGSMMLPTAHARAGALPPPIDDTSAELLSTADTDDLGLLRTSSTSAVGEYHALTPQRVLDTRSGLGRDGRVGKIGPGEMIVATLAGVAGVPLTGVEAVVMNVTATNPTSTSFLTLWATGSPRHEVSNLNFAGGQTVPNLVTVTTNALGQVSLYNDRGSTDVIFDIAGYYSTASGEQGDRFLAVEPTRVLDTRKGTGRAAGKVANHPIDIDVLTGPALQISPTAVVLDVTVADPSEWSFLTVFPAGQPQPVVSNLNYIRGQTVPNQVIVPLPASGMISLANAFGTTDVIVDVVGFYHSDRNGNLGRYIPFEPFRWFDSRIDTDAFGGKLQNGEGLIIGPPQTWASGYVMNVTVTDPEAAGYVTAYPSQSSPPVASVLNFVPGQTVANHVIVGASPTSTFDVSGGPTHMIIDIYGAFT